MSLPPVNRIEQLVISDFVGAMLTHKKGVYSPESAESLVKEGITNLLGSQPLFKELVPTLIVDAYNPSITAKSHPEEALAVLKLLQEKGASLSPENLSPPLGSWSACETKNAVHLTNLFLDQLPEYIMTHLGLGERKPWKSWGGFYQTTLYKLKTSSMDDVKLLQTLRTEAKQNRFQYKISERNPIDAGGIFFKNIYIPGDKSEIEALFKQKVTTKKVA